MRRWLYILFLILVSRTGLFAHDYYEEAEGHYYAARYSEAILVALEGLSQPDLQESDKVELYSILGSAYSRLGDFDKAADYMIRCYEFDKNQGDLKGLTSSLINLASMYVYAGKADLAVDYALEAIENEHKIGRQDKLAMAYGKVCDVYHAMGRDSSALEYANTAVAIANKELDDVARAIRRSQRAYPLEALGRYPDALADLKYAEKVFRNNNVRQSLCIVCFQLAQEYGRENRTTLERQYLREAALIAREVRDLPLLQKICSRMAASLQRSDSSQAFLYLQEASSLQDSIFLRKSSNALELFNIEYETARREKTIAQQSVEIMKQRRQRGILAVSLFFLLAVAAIAVAAARSIRKREIQLIASNAQKDFLFKVISHDIHSPAVAQLRGLQMLRTHGSKMSEKELGDVFLQLERQAESEVELIDNVLRWAKSKSGSRALEAVRFTLDDLVGEVVSQQAGSASAKGISVELDSPGNVVCCSVRSNLMLALRNLLSNAIKFSPREGKITIEIHPEENGARLSVIDRGIGIPKDKLGGIFETASEFRRSGTDGEPSNGLGLAVSRDLVKEIGSDISVESEEGTGSCFTIHIHNLTENA